VDTGVRQIVSLTSFTSENAQHDVLVVRLENGPICKGADTYALPTGGDANQTTVALLTAAFLNGRGVRLIMNTAYSSLSGRCRITFAQLQ
jgi:hypothetical protein